MNFGDNELQNAIIFHDHAAGGNRLRCELRGKNFSVNLGTKNLENLALSSTRKIFLALFEHFSTFF